MHDSAIANFRKNFTEILVQYSRDFQKRLKILLTSQLEVKPRRCEFRSFNLEPPSLPTCVTMFSKFAIMSSDTVYYVSDSPCTTGCLERGKVESVCTRVGRVPKLLVTLASHLSDNITIDHLIDRLNKSALKYALDSGNKTHLIAYEVMFDYIQPKYQICSLLLNRFPGFFTVAMSELIITRDLMKEYSKSFHVSECINDLERKKIIEITIYRSLTAEVRVNYHIHNLTRDFLMTTDKVSVPKQVLKDFWDVYFEQGDDFSMYLYLWSREDLWLREDLSEENTNIVLDFLWRREHNSYRLARHLTSDSFSEMGGAVARVRDEAVKMLLADCRDLSLTYSLTTALVLLECYRQVFSLLFAEIDQDSMDKLAVCEAKYKQLNSVVKVSTVTVDNFSIANCLYFQHTISLRCKLIHNAHELCGRSWRYNLFDFIDVLQLELDSVEETCNSHITYPDCMQYIAPCYTNNGLTLYSTAKHAEAVDQLHLSLKDNSNSNCREVHDVTLYIVLYDIYSNRSDQEKADEMLANIAQIEFKQANLTCYQTLVKDIVIPFLDWINSSDLAEQTDTLKGLPYSRFILKIIRIFSMLPEERTDQIFAGEESLFCLVSMDVFEGCLS